MTKAEYMEKLQERLESFGQELQEEIMEDYRQHFTEGEMQGKSEEEIIQELGNIEEMIRELPEEESSGNPGWKQEMKDGFEKIVQSVPEAGSEFKDSLRKFIQKMPEVQLGFEQKSRELDGAEYYDYPGEYKGIVLDAREADIFLLPSEDEQIHVEYRNNGNPSRRTMYEYYQYDKDGVFYAGVKHRNNTGGGDKERFKVTLFGQTIVSYGKVCEFGDAEIVLIVKAPAGMPRIEAKTTSGDLRVREIHTEHLEASTASGDLQVESVELGYLKASSTSGDMALSEGGIRDAKISTASGDMEIDRTVFERGTLSAGSGDITLNGTKIQFVNIHTGSGDIDVEGGCFKIAECKAGSGDITVEASAEEYDCAAGSGDISVNAGEGTRKVVVATGSGDISIDLNGIPGMEVSVSTFGGDADVTFGGERRRDLRNGVYTYGDGSCRVSAKSGSGDISVSAE